MIDWTITSIFFVPTLRLPKEEMFKNGFINGYHRDKHREDTYKNCIYVLFKPNDINKFREFLDGEYERTDSIIDDYDYEGGYVVVVYELNPIWGDDFNLIREGKYSKTSAPFQSFFPKMVKITKKGIPREELSLQFRIFHKAPDLVKFWEDRIGQAFVYNKGEEVWGKFFLENETLDLDRIKQLM